MYRVNAGQHLMFLREDRFIHMKMLIALRWPRNAPNTAMSESECGTEVRAVSAQTSREGGSIIPAPHALLGGSALSPITSGLSYGHSITT